MNIRNLTIDDLTTLTESRIEIIQTLARNGPLSPKDVADEIGKTATAVASSFRSLRQKGWIEYASADTADHQLSDRGLTIAGILEEYLAEYHPDS